MSDERTGNILFVIGALFLPLGVGATAGYWISDAGVRWIPDTLGALLILWVVGLGLMVVGGFKKQARKRTAFAAALLILAVVVRFGVYVASRPSVLSQRSSADFARAFQDDVRQFSDLERTLSRAVAIVEANVPEKTVLTADQEAIVGDAFAAFVDSGFALDQIRRFYEDYYRLDLSRLERDRHLLSFLLTFDAELALFEHTLRIVEAVDNNENAAKFLDVARGHLPPESFTAVREELLGMTDFSRVVAGKRYLQYLDELHDARTEVATRGHDALWRDVERRLMRLDRAGAAKLSVEALASDVAPLEKSVKHVSFPVQKGVAEWMGDTRVKRVGRYLVDEELRKDLHQRLQPGDILLARKNWYLSNVGLPGFWPHAMIYVGTNEDLAKAFGDAYLRRLEARFPLALRRRGAHPELLIIEAISEGVSQSDLHHTVGDYVAALRPNLPSDAKARAIERAFAMLGKPYDFDFDFATDDALVCTEVVWRSYRTSEDGVGLQLGLVRVAGRMTLPANEFARVFRDEKRSEHPQLSFVAYIEGREHHQDAIIRDEAAFSATADRSKWDFGQP